MSSENCFHCGLVVPPKIKIICDEKSFCCSGCKSVYLIFRDGGLMSYYSFEKSPGSTPGKIEDKYNFLEDENITAKLLEFNEGTSQIASLQIPQIHCSSCIWILENLNRLESGIVFSQANFPEKKVRISYNPEKTSLKNIVTLLSEIGYEPYISLDDYASGKKKTDRSLTYKLGVAFFCFGNIMLLSFPEYFDVSEYWLDQYRGFFRWLIFVLSLPSFLYSASGYYAAAYHSLKARMLNIEVPIALGIIVMFIRSTVDIVYGNGQGFFDSLTGLVFFMLLGKMFQVKTYGFLSFARDYKSYFPIAVTRLNADLSELPVPVYEIQKGDRLLIRNQEIIPVDSELVSESTSIDYSFVSGEAIPVSKKKGDHIFAGGKQLGSTIEIEVLKTVSQSYLTQLWSNEAFIKETKKQYKTITDKVSRYFTPILLAIAILGFGYWAFIDLNIAFNVFTAVLIVACPCALALTVPFTMGNILRILGKAKFYLKDALVIEKLAKIDTIVFDKTGTITTAESSDISWQGTPISDETLALVKNVLRTSNHPLSRMLYDSLPGTAILPLQDVMETPGKGIRAVVNCRSIKLGSAPFVNAPQTNNPLQTSICISIDNTYLGRYIFKNKYRPGLQELFKDLSERYQIKILSGDNDGEQDFLKKLLPEGIELVFNQKPEQKLEFIRQLQLAGHNVLMVGDGLNDAGALAQSDVGISLSENVNVFSPACDAILDASCFVKISRYLWLSKKAISVVKMSFVLSLLYNVIGLSFAVSGHLLPLVAAIIMPLSTVTIISFVTAMSNFYARKI